MTRTHGRKMCIRGPLEDQVGGGRKRGECGLDWHEGRVGQRSRESTSWVGKSGFVLLKDANRSHGSGWRHPQEEARLAQDGNLRHWVISVKNRKKVSNP